MISLIRRWVCVTSYSKYVFPQRKVRKSARKMSLIQTKALSRYAQYFLQIKALGRFWHYWKMFLFNTGYDSFMVIVMTYFVIYDDRNECNLHSKHAVYTKTNFSTLNFYFPLRVEKKKRKQVYGILFSIHALVTSTIFEAYLLSFLDTDAIIALIDRQRIHTSSIFTCIYIFSIQNFNPDKFEALVIL